MAAGSRTRILIVDDSAVMRNLLRSVIAVDPQLEVAGTAGDGASALGAIETQRPDLVVLDVEMPVMDGLETLRKMRSRGHKMPVIMCSSLTQRGAKVTFDALAAGASDYVAKPSGQANREQAVQTLAQQLGPRIHALTHPGQGGAPAGNPVFMPRLNSPTLADRLSAGARVHSPFPAQPAPKSQPIPSAPKVVAIGVSTGGPAALDAILPALPADFPLPVLIVQHMPELFTKYFAERLDSRCRIRVREASEGDPVVAGLIYVARGNWHMEVQAPAKNGFPATLRLNQGPQENHCRPAVDPMLRSVVSVYKSGVLAVILTGMGSDGLNGCRIVRDNGGGVLAQDQATSTVWGMPGAVTNAGLANKVVALNQIIPEILRQVSRTHSEVSELRELAVS